MKPGASPRGGLSTPLLPEVVPETDANPVSFYSGGVGLEVGHQKLEVFQIHGGFAP